MNNPASSDVSEALVIFAAASAADCPAQVIEAAGLAISQARADATASDDAARIAALLRSQASSPNDARVRAWSLGATLATQAPPSPSTVILAAVIATGEAFSASDGEATAAVAIGIEASVRILAAVDDEEFRARWNVASSVGVLGAALAVSRLLNLGIAQTRHALGLAATQAAGLARNAGEPIEAIEVGKAAADALESALMARHGFTSAPASVEGRRGFAALMAYRFDLASITEGLGTHWVSSR